MEMELHHADSHLVSAVMSADKVRNLEKELREGVEDPGEYNEIPFSREHSAMVQSCVMSSFAFLEAFVNETWNLIQNLDEIQPFLSFNNQLSPNNGFTQYSTLPKYQAILVAGGTEPFPKGEAPFQEVRWLQKLRNYWVHYEPDSVSSEDPVRESESSLESALRDRVEPNPKLADSDEAFLPRLAISYDCCTWAIYSAIEFVEAFRSKVGDRRHLTYLDEVEAILKRDDH